MASAEFSLTFHLHLKKINQNVFFKSEDDTSCKTTCGQMSFDSCGQFSHRKKYLRLNRSYSPKTVKWWSNGQITGDKGLSFLIAIVLH